MTTPTLRAQGYVTRPPPAAYDAGWLFTELQNIQNAIRGSVVRGETTNTTQRKDDRVILMDCTGGARTVTLLPPTAWPVWSLTVIKVDASANAVTLGGTVNGALNPTLAVQYTSYTISSSGTLLYIE